MRRLLLILAALLVMTLSLASCNNEMPKEPIPHIGSKWYAPYSDYLLVSKDTSDTDSIDYYVR